MYPIMRKENDRTGDYAVEVKEASKPFSSKNVSWEDKGKGKAISLIDAELIPEVMPVAKRTRSVNGEAGPSAKKGKPATVDLSPQPKKKERKPRRRYKTADLNIGEGQEEYNLLEDMKERTACITFAQLLGMYPKLKREWKRLASPKKVKEQEPKERWT